MAKWTAVVGIFLWAASASAWAGEPVMRKLQWNELGPRIENRKVAFELPDGTHVEGRVIAVQPDGLRMKVTKSSNRKVQAKGKRLVPREGLRLLRVTEYRWMGRLLCTVGAMGVATAIVASRQIDLYEGPQVVLVPVMAGVGVVGTGVGGYFAGKRIDKRVIDIVIVP
jgi:hypothetical protein